MAHARLAAVFGLTGALASCAAPQQAPPPPRPVPRAVAPDPLADRAWGVVDSPRFFLSLPLPELSSWHVDDASGRWLVATHLASKSVILARAWREGAVVSHADCEAIARPWRRDLFGPDRSALVDRAPLDAPPGFSGEVGYAVHRAKDALGGVAVLAAANVRRCLVIAYVTRAEGPDAPSIVARRLAFVTAKVFAAATARSVEDRVPSPRP